MENRCPTKQTIKEQTIKEQTIKDRIGQCYYLSGKYIMENQNVTLVHGSINGKFFTGIDFDNPHAWIEWDGNVYDPVLNKSWLIPVYYIIMQIKVSKKYTWKETNERILIEQHWGPWDQ